METAREFALAQKLGGLPNNDAYNQRKKAKPTDLWTSFVSFVVS